MSDIESIGDGCAGATYTYDPRRYLFDVKVPAVVAAAVLPVALFFVVSGTLPPLAIGVSLLCVYVLFNTFVAHAYPQTVELDDAKLTVTSFGRTDTFRLADIERLQVRENGTTHSAYIRINGGGLTRGRYFVGCGDLRRSNGEQALDLFRFFLDTEARLDPNNLRVRSRLASARKVAEKEGRREPSCGRKK